MGVFYPNFVTGHIKISNFSADFLQKFERFWPPVVKRLFAEKSRASSLPKLVQHEGHEGTQRGIFAATPPP